MPSRSDIIDKWHRLCTNCGRRVHINLARANDCPTCGNDTWTRNKQQVSA